MKFLRTARTLATASALGFGLCLALGSCGPSVPVGLDSPDPQGRTIALARAAEDPAGDEEQLRQLIVMLDSADSAQRMLAIRALERATGETLGYRHFAPEAERQAGQRRWVEWYRSRGGEASVERAR